jgi:hypothetical protein
MGLGLTLSLGPSALVAPKVDLSRKGTLNNVISAAYAITKDIFAVDDEPRVISLPAFRENPLRLFIFVSF